MIINKHIPHPTLQLYMYLDFLRHHIYLRISYITTHFLKRNPINVLPCKTTEVHELDELWHIYSLMGKMYFKGE